MMRHVMLILAVFASTLGINPLLKDPPAPEDPVMNLPRSMREWNWGGGSCVHASTVHLLRWSDNPELAAVWRTRYAGGESSSGLRAKLTKNQVPFTYTERGDAEVLEYASRTRRGAVIFYYPNHSINFCGFAQKDGAPHAVLLDNNRIDNWIWVPKETFLKSWRGYGGFALSLGYSPAPRIPYSPWEKSL